MDNATDLVQGYYRTPLGTVRVLPMTGAAHKGNPILRGEWAKNQEAAKGWQPVCLVRTDGAGARSLHFPNAGVEERRVAAAVGLVDATPAQRGAYGEAYQRATGRCCRCGRRIWQGISVRRGMGPVCFARMTRYYNLPMAPPEPADAPGSPQGGGIAAFDAGAA